MARARQRRRAWRRQNGALQRGADCDPPLGPKPLSLPLRHSLKFRPPAGVLADGDLPRVTATALSRTGDAEQPLLRAADGSASRGSRSTTVVSPRPRKLYYLEQPTRPVRKKFRVSYRTGL